MTNPSPGNAGILPAPPQPKPTTLPLPTPLVVGIHGILSLGIRSTDLLLLELRKKDLRTHNFDHGWKPAIFAGITARHYACKLIEQLQEETRVSVVAHSFGARIALEAMRLGYRFEYVYLFNPAIPAKTSFPKDCYESITVIANSKDRILKWSKLLLRPFGYGNLGQVGYQGKSPRVKTCFTTAPWNFGLGQHGHAFTRSALKKWAHAIHLDLLYPF